MRRLTHPAALTLLAMVISGGLAGCAGTTAGPVALEAVPPSQSVAAVQDIFALPCPQSQEAIIEIGRTGVMPFANTRAGTGQNVTTFGTAIAIKRCFGGVENPAVPREYRRGQSPEADAFLDRFSVPVTTADLSRAGGRGSFNRAIIGASVTMVQYAEGPSLVFVTTPALDTSGSGTPDADGALSIGFMSNEFVVCTIPLAARDGVAPVTCRPR
jgi:hypothetical protein